jgi:hypothetical protein
MMAIAFVFVRMLCDCFKSRRRLEAEKVLRHQVNVLQRRTPRRLHLRWADRALFIWLYRRCPPRLDAITIFKPETVVLSHRMGFAPTGDESPVRPAADRGSAKRCADPKNGFREPALGRP